MRVERGMGFNGNGQACGHGKNAIEQLHIVNENKELNRAFGALFSVRLRRQPSPVRRHRLTPHLTLTDKEFY
jgi:hypothetical protein